MNTFQCVYELFQYSVIITFICFFMSSVSHACAQHLGLVFKGKQAMCMCVWWKHKPARHGGYSRLGCY